MDCKICYEPFDQGGHLPKAIPCGHTVCSACLQRLLNRKCPTCQQVFMVPLSQIPNNYTVLEFLQARPDRTDKSPGWCSRCSAVAKPQCRGQHVVLGVREALEQLLEGVRSQAAGQLQRLLKNQCQEEEAVQALALLSGEAWQVTLRNEWGMGPPLTGKLRDTKDPLTKAVLFFLATKGEVKQAATVPIKNSIFTSLGYRKDLSPKLAGNLNVSSEITNSICTPVLDCAKDLSSDDLDGNLLVFRGVQRLLNVSTEVAPHLPIAEPTVQELSLRAPTSLTALRAALAMSRLKRLRVDVGVTNWSFHEEVSAAGASLSQGLTDAPARLQWLELICIPCDLLPLLLPAHRLTLRVLQLQPSYKVADPPHQKTVLGRYVKQHVTCNQLLSLLAQCDLRALQKLVLVDALPINHSSSPANSSRLNDRSAPATCARQRGMLLAALPAGARVLCWKCDGDTCREVF